MRYEGQIYRPPSEAWSLIVQATIGCSWNRCTYCDMYRTKQFRVRPLEEVTAELEEAAGEIGPDVRKIFVADGDALTLPVDYWKELLATSHRVFPNLRRVSSYAMARNINDKTEAELGELQDAGLTLLYIGPESGDDVTLKRIVKGDTAQAHVEAAQKAHAAGMKLSVIALLGVGGVKRSNEHAEETAKLITGMDPEFFSALTLTVVPETPIARAEDKNLFELPTVEAMLGELRTMVDLACPRDAIFRTNHASNYLPLAGRLPRDRERLLDVIDSALGGDFPLRSEWQRGL